MAEIKGHKLNHSAARSLFFNFLMSTQPPPILDWISLWPTLLPHPKGSPILTETIIIPRLELVILEKLLGDMPNILQYRIFPGVSLLNSIKTPPERTIMKGIRTTHGSAQDYWVFFFFFHGPRLLSNHSSFWHRIGSKKQFNRYLVNWVITWNSV